MDNGGTPSCGGHEGKSFFMFREGLKDETAGVQTQSSNGGLNPVPSVSAQHGSDILSRNRKKRLVYQIHFGVLSHTHTACRVLTAWMAPQRASCFQTKWVFNGMRVLVRRRRRHRRRRNKQAWWTSHTHTLIVNQVFCWTDEVFLRLLEPRRLQNWCWVSL